MPKQTHLILIVTAALAVTFFTAMFVAGLFRRAQPTPQPVQEPSDEETLIIAPLPEGGIAEVDPDTGTVVAEPAEPGDVHGLDRLPPSPVTVHERGAQGLRRVDFYPLVGDIFHVIYDRESDRLLMSVVEPDGLRAVWRLTGEETIERVLEGRRSPTELFIGTDSRGRIYASLADPGHLYRSEDFGDTWELVASDIDGAFWGIADDGNGTAWGALHAYNRALLYRSLDDGHHWLEWKDFHEVFPEHAVPYREGDPRYRLRHLHDVAYLDGKLFVGTGDVVRPTLMSEDDGETWREIWSEGFTAHVPLRDGSGVLLGPDRLQTHGIAFYDFASGRTEEVWSPVPYGWSGFTYSMAEIDGMYFAAFHTEANEVESFAGRSGVIVSPDGRTWHPFLELDPLTNWARTDIYLEPRDRWSGWITLNGQLYIFEVPIGRWFDVHPAFGE